MSITGNPRCPLCDIRLHYTRTENYLWCLSCWVCGFGGPSAAAKQTARKATLPWLKKTSRQKAITEALDELRKDEGGSIWIPCDNPEPGDPAAYVVAVGEWTGWAQERFAGDDLPGALKAAAEIRRIRELDTAKGTESLDSPKGGD